MSFWNYCKDQILVQASAYVLVFLWPKHDKLAYRTSEVIETLMHGSVMGTRFPNVALIPTQRSINFVHFISFSFWKNPPFILINTELPFHAACRLRGRFLKYLAVHGDDEFAVICVHRCFLNFTARIRTFCQDKFFLISISIFLPILYFLVIDVL